VARLILDTGVLIAGARGTFDIADLPEQDDMAVPAIVVAEYLVGISLDENVGRRATQRAFLDEVLALSPVEEYDAIVAEHHAELIAHVRRLGRSRGAHDLIIAATAKATGRVLLTTDKCARFDELPGVQTRVVTV
jgi:tRNA(fMet)-specific endonuclease VapC